MSPADWLIGLVERPDGYRALVNDAGSLAVAAWRLAQARCCAREVSTHVPSRMEVRAAARELTSRLGLSTGVPASRQLARECEEHGFLVL